MYGCEAAGPPWYFPVGQAVVSNIMQLFENVSSDKNSFLKGLQKVKKSSKSGCICKPFEKDESSFITPKLFLAEFSPETQIF